MKNKQGFTLIEVVVALTCSVFALALCVQSSFYFYKTWRQEARVVEKRMMVTSALDVVRRDLAQVPLLHTYWFVTHPSEIIWQTGHGNAVCLSVVNGRLERREGSYVTATQSFSTNATSVLATGVDHCTFVMHKSMQGNYRGVTVMLALGDGYKEQIVCGLNEA